MADGKAGRPPKDYTVHQIARIGELALKGCQTRTIARIMDLDETSLRRHFDALIKKKRAERKLALLEKIDADSAPAITIFRAKNELGWTDRQEQTITAEIKMFDKDCPIEDV